jgi:RNA polymerase sigma-70 factor (ECF subfamily)
LRCAGGFALDLPPAHRQKAQLVGALAVRAPFADRMAVRQVTAGPNVSSPAPHPIIIGDPRQKLRGSWSHPRDDTVVAVGDDVEGQIGTLLRAAHFEAAATDALSAYGPELYGFLINMMGSEPDASEVFSQTAEDFWRALPTFERRCSVRTWLYLLARNAASRFWRSPWHRAAGSAASRLDSLVDEARSRTQPWLRTDVKDKWRELRESLAPDDRALLVLRVDRDLDWSEVARVMLGRPEADGDELAREAARLRKRYHHLKDELRERARAAGLLDGDDRP